MRNNWYYLNDKKRTICIVLNNYDKPTLVSSRHLKKLMELDVTWFLKKGRHAYVCCNIASKGRRKTLQLHRYITSCPDNMVVDHKNGDTINNKDYNLRKVTVGENNQNLTKLRKDSTTGVSGVTYRPTHRRPYIVQVRVDNKRLCYKSFFTLEEARLEAEYVRRQYLKYSYQDEKETNK